MKAKFIYEGVNLLKGKSDDDIQKSLKDVSEGISQLNPPSQTDILSQIKNAEGVDIFENDIFQIPNYFTFTNKGRVGIYVKDAKDLPKALGFENLGSVYIGFGEENVITDKKIEYIPDDYIFDMGPRFHTDKPARLTIDALNVPDTIQILCPISTLTLRTSNLPKIDYSTCDRIRIPSVLVKDIPPDTIFKEGAFIEAKNGYSGKVIDGQIKWNP